MGHEKASLFKYNVRILRYGNIVVNIRDVRTIITGKHRLLQLAGNVGIVRETFVTE